MTKWEVHLKDGRVIEEETTADKHHGQECIAEVMLSGQPIIIGNHVFKHELVDFVKCLGEME